MRQMKCFGINAVSGEAVLVEASSGIISLVDPLVEAWSGLDHIAPGFIDLQVNGYAGVDYNSPTTPHEEIGRSIRVQYSCGVTRLYPTVITGSPEGMRGSLKNLAAAKATIPEGPAMEGFHVEGPHISPDDGPRGAHPVQWVRKPDLDEYRGWQEATDGAIRLVTLAPEWPEAAEYIDALVREGVVVAIGHTNATGDQIRAAVSAGATLSTHLGNGAHQILRRHPNYIWEQLAEDRLAADFIADGIHLPASFLKSALRAKGIERCILVTDASTPAAAEPGFYKLADQEVELTADDRVVLTSSRKLAGSALRMHKGVENLMRMGGISLPEAITMATRNPARVGRISSRQRGLAAGDRADLVEFKFDGATKSIEIIRTWLGGELVHGDPE